jgi:hypothetical protein
MPTNPAVDLAKMPDAITDLVKGYPVLKPILTGELPGVRVQAGVYYPKAWELAEEMDRLFEAGLDIYIASDGSQVLYNPSQLEEAALQKADKEGVLTQVIPDYQEVTGEAPVKPSPAIQKKMDEFYTQIYGAPFGGSAPGGAALPPGGGDLSADLVALANGGAQAAMPTLAPQAQAAMAKGRALNMQVGAPTSGPSPGSGRVINNLAKAAL